MKGDGIEEAEIGGRLGGWNCAGGDGCLFLRVSWWRFGGG